MPPNALPVYAKNAKIDMNPNGKSAVAALATESKKAWKEDR